MSQLRHFAPPFRSNGLDASYPASKAARVALGSYGRGAAPPSPIEGFAAAGRLSTAATPRKSTAFAHFAFSLAAAACDLFAIMTAALISGWCYALAFDSPHVVVPMFSVGSIVAALFLLGNSTRQEYRFDNYLQLNGHAGRSATLWALAFLYVLAIGFSIKMTNHYSRGAIIIFFFAGIPALIGARIAAVRFARKYVGRESIMFRRVFVVGYPDEIAIFRERYEASMVGMDIVGVFPLRRHGQTLRDVEVAAEAARALWPDEALIIVPWAHKKTIDACVEVFRKLPVSIHLGPEAVLTPFTRARISEIGSVLTLNLVRQPLSNGDLIAKRLFDLVGASASLVALTPFFVLVAVLIRLDSAGPVLFSQRRYGFNREPFRILKFRTMTTMEDGACVVAARRNDPRVTRVGRWLRRYNIDELPQLVNVLRGEMSLVGPRPHASAHDDMFEPLVACYARRHNMKPGITGWAQVNGFRGEIRTRDDILHRIEHDLFYLDNWSVWLDFKCIWRTICSARAYCNAY